MSLGGRSLGEQLGHESLPVGEALDVEGDCLDRILEPLGLGSSVGSRGELAGKRLHAKLARDIAAKLKLFPCIPPGNAEHDAQGEGEYARDGEKFFHGYGLRWSRERPLR